MATKKGIGRYFALDYLTEGLILKNLVFVLFLGVLAIVYIANSHFAERNVRQVQTVQKEIKEPFSASPHSSRLFCQAA